MKLSEVTEYMRTQVKKEEIPIIAQNPQLLPYKRLRTAMTESTERPADKLFWHLVSVLKGLDVVYGGGILFSIEWGIRTVDNTVYAYTPAFDDMLDKVKETFLTDIVKVGFTHEEPIVAGPQHLKVVVHFGKFKYCLRFIKMCVKSPLRIDRGGYIGVSPEFHVAEALFTVQKGSIHENVWSYKILEYLSNTSINVSTILTICYEKFELCFEDIFRIHMGLTCYSEYLDILEDNYNEQEIANLRSLFADLSLVSYNSEDSSMTTVLNIVNDSINNKVIIGGMFALKYNGLLPDLDIRTLHVLSDSDYDFAGSPLVHMLRHPTAGNFKYCEALKGNPHLMCPEPERAIIDYALSSVVSAHILQDVLKRYVKSIDTLDKLYEVAEVCGQDDCFVDTLLCHMLYVTPVVDLI